MNFRHKYTLAFAALLYSYFKEAEEEEAGDGNEDKDDEDEGQNKNQVRFILYMYLLCKRRVLPEILLFFFLSFFLLIFILFEQCLAYVRLSLWHFCSNERMCER